MHEVRFFCHFEQISHHETQDRLNDLNATRIVVNATRCTLAPLYHCRFSENIYICFRCTYAAYFLIGVTGVVFFSSITRFSGLWFPSEQRATATGLTITCANMGSLLPALTSPLIVSGKRDFKVSQRKCKAKSEAPLVTVSLSLRNWIRRRHCYFPNVSVASTKCNQSLCNLLRCF